jgi:hypothetical protein
LDKIISRNIGYVRTVGAKIGEKVDFLELDMDNVELVPHLIHIIYK